MARFAHFSKHALQRISQRTKLNYFSIADILDYGGAIDVGTEPVFDRKHLLFFSDIDDCFFVAIQDSITGLVVTVLPIDYHENIAWKIEADAFLESRRLAYNCLEMNREESAKVPASILIVKARYLSEEGYQKTVTLTKLKSAEHGEDLSNILNHESFESKILAHCKRKEISPFSLYEITIALGNDGEPLSIDWKFPFNSEQHA